jgi:adenylate cyclase
MPAKRKNDSDIINMDSTFPAEQRQKLEMAEMLLGISRTIAAFETLDEMLTKLVEMTSEEVNAERGTIFLNDAAAGELYSRVAQGNFHREIRIINNSGVAGHVFTSGEGRIVNDAYSDEYFSPEIDMKTGFKTRSILCVPIKTVKGEIIGVAQSLNRKKGKFSEEDLSVLSAMTTQAAVALQSAQFIEQMKKNRMREMEFVDVVSDITSEINLGALLNKVMAEATRMLNSERSTLFLNDDKKKLLFSQVGEGLGATQISFPNHLGIAGMVFTSGKTVNIPYAYADLRFNPSFDKQTGFFTRSILCTPVINKDGKIIGVTQVLNKRGGPFTNEDESRLKAFTAQVSIALENAKLFDDIQNMKNYNEGILESMSNGVITLNEDGKILTCNAAGFNIMEISSEDIIDKTYGEFFIDSNAWVGEKIKRVEETQASDVTMDADMQFGTGKLSVNLTILPLVSIEQKKLGSMIMIEDISSEKRMKSTMSRYMDPDIADQLMEDGEDILGGKSTVATVLFSDIRSFTTLTEELGPQGTVALLNEYFTIMVDCIMAEGGMLDKFIGDAIMAAFGMPLDHGDDPDRAVRAAISMQTSLHEWNMARAADGKNAVNIGIGLNTDNVVSGNIGSPKRMDYTLIGDGVNLAARLESACKQYSAKILISVNTVNKLHGTYRTREIDNVIVKGKTEPVSIYEVLDFHTDESFPNLMGVVNYFSEGIKHYRENRWDESVKAFEECLKLNPDDKLSQMYIDRCEYLRLNPPADDWQGVWKMTSK